MENEFQEPLFKDVEFSSAVKSNIIKSTDIKVEGKTKITIEEDTHDGVKIVLKKDSNNTIKEIKFICSCGQTKSIVLDYSE